MSPESPEYKYLQQLQAEERKRADSILIDSVSSLDQASRQAVSGLFAEISARVRVIEEYLVANQESSQDNAFTAFKSVDEDVPHVESKVVRVGIADISVGFGVLSETFHDEAGLPYRFINSKATLKISFSADRTHKSTLCVDIESAKSLDKLKSFELQVDGLKTRFRIANINGHLRFLAHLPKRETSGPTHLRLIAPTLRSNHDVALADVYCVPRLTAAGFIKKFFKDN